MATLSSFKLLCVSLLVSSCGNSEEPNCGPSPTASYAAFTVVVNGENISYGDFVSSPNNDCPFPGSPTSLTIEGRQITPSTDDERSVVLCVPQPDIFPGAATLGDDEEILNGEVQLIDIFGEYADCTFSLNQAVVPTGDIAVSGFCEDGTHEDGFVMSVTNGTLGLLVDCGSGSNLASASLEGALIAVPQ